MNYQKPTKKKWRKPYEVFMIMKKKYENVFNMSQKTTIKVKKDETNILRNR